MKVDNTNDNEPPQHKQCCAIFDSHFVLSRCCWGSHLCLSVDVVGRSSLVGSWGGSLPADRCAVFHPLPPIKKPLDFGSSLFCVLDGHGGEWCAEYVAVHLGICVAVQNGYGSGSKPAAKEAALLKGFLYCDQRCLVEQESNGEKSGSTACAVLVDHTDIYVANCGDTRAILCRAGQAIELSRDHKPTDPEEKARMEAAGGRVPPGSAYVELGDKGLAVARAFGNPLFKQNPTKSENAQIIIPHPYQSRMARQFGTDEFILIATDGLWNVVSRPSELAHAAFS